MQAVWFFVINNFILFAPIYLTAYLVLDYKLKKLYFCITVFGARVIGGYCTANGLTVNIHLSDKKVILFDVKEYVKKRKGLITLEGIQLYNFSLQTRCNFANFNLVNLLLAFCVINNELAPVICYRRPYVKLKNDLVLVKEECFATVLKASVFLNIFTVTNLLIKSLIKRVVKYVKGK